MSANVFWGDGSSEDKTNYGARYGGIAHLANSDTETYQENRYAKYSGSSIGWPKQLLRLTSNMAIVLYYRVGVTVSAIIARFAL